MVKLVGSRNGTTDMKAFKHILALSATLLLITQMGWSQGDNPEPTVVSIGGSSTINCLSADQVIGVSITGWISGFDYQWNTGESDSVISVKPAQTTTYFLQITHTALGISELRGFEIKVENDPINVVESNYVQDNKTCKGSELVIEPAFSGGHAPFSFTWDNGLETRTQIIYPEHESEHVVTITDACGTISSSNILVEVEEHEPITPAPLKIYEFNCANELLSLKPNLTQVSGGVGSGYKYSFNDWATHNEPFEIKAQNGKIVEVEFTDECSQQLVSSEIKLIQTELEAPVLGAITACENEVVNITDFQGDKSIFYWDGSVMNTDYNYKVTENEKVTLTYLDICGEARKIDRQIVLSDVDSEFDYDAHESAGTVELFTTNTENDLTFEWTINGEKAGYSNVFEVSLEAGSTNEVELTTMNKDGCMATTSRIVTVRDNYSVPSAFSPNNDGKNDFFKLNIDEEFNDFSIDIFDRWGQLIYHSNDQYFAWKGEERTSGVLNAYVYKINGTTIGGGKVEKTGTLTVVN
ncbi:gliding motility-associated C-terminal domain-containing protein [bacterium]|nr:gliding motility-associated C-terminal domain-containing protein [bacterium]